jgi:hypothetical protein
LTLQPRFVIAARRTGWLIIGPKIVAQACRTAVSAPGPGGMVAPRPAVAMATGNVAPPGRRGMRLVNGLARTGRLGSAAGVLFLLVILLLPVAAASAAEPAGVELNGGCTVALTSLDASGGVIDSAMGPGVADVSNPLDVDLQGTVLWEGTAPLITTGSYQVTVNGAPVPGFSGPIDNPGGITSASGTAEVGSFLGFLAFAQDWMTLTWNVAGSVTGPDAGCSGQVWVRTGQADPLFSGGAIAGIALGALGLVGLLRSIKGRHGISGLFAGLIVGIALALLVMTFGVYILGPLTPWIALGSMTLLGFIVGLIPIG